jgi:hypothetical protein
MQIETIEAPWSVRSGWTPVRTWLAILAGVVAALALAAQALLAWQALNTRALDLGAPGGLYSVQLVNGQMFYGTLLESRAGAVKLGDVYYTQPFTQPNGQPGNRVVSRKKNDWHGPEWQLIPVERILQMEAVGEKSQLAVLIAQDKAAAK